MTNGSSTSPTAAAAAFEWVTTTNLVLIAIAMLIVVLAILWGARMKRARKAAEQRVAATQGVMVADPGPVTTAVPTPPPPPPLTRDDTTVAAAAPFTASADALPGDLATLPVERAGGDDLTQLKGVGPRLAARLGELGITRYAQVAALSPAEADALDAQLGSFRGRLTRDRWIEQAGYLAKGDRAGFEAAFGRL